MTARWRRAYSIAIRRAARSGVSGNAIEDLGVRGIPYAMTRDDLLKDRHLRPAGVLREPVQGAQLSFMRVFRGAGSLEVTTKGLDTLEVDAQGSPVAAAAEVADGSHRLNVPTDATIDLVGRFAGQVRQRRRLLMA
jgi:hypothetical protein